MPTVALWGSDFIASISASLVSSHLLGSFASARSGVRSQLSEAVVGGGLHAIVPVRSTTNKRFAGSSADSTVEVAQPPSRIASASSAGIEGARPPVPEAPPPVLEAPPLAADAP